MSKKVLIISTSLRKNSNSEALADSFAAGAQSAGHLTEKISLRGKKIAFCQGCLACQRLHKCVIDDDAVPIAEKMCQADVIVFATPIYYYEMCGQMKTLLDRANALFSLDYSFRSIYLLSTAADESSSSPERAINGLQGWIECFDKAELTGSVFAGGVEKGGDIEGHQALQQAYNLGQSIK
ncbi:MAG: flavodoxin family protein [Candidatus Bruticola sp.]